MLFQSVSADRWAERPPALKGFYDSNSTRLPPHFHSPTLTLTHYPCHPRSLPHTLARYPLTLVLCPSNSRSLPSSPSLATPLSLALPPPRSLAPSASPSPALPASRPRCLPFAHAATPFARAASPLASPRHHPPRPSCLPDLVRQGGFKRYVPDGGGVQNEGSEFEDTYIEHRR